jgi:hypothetical protein
VLVALMAKSTARLQPQPAAPPEAPNEVRGARSIFQDFSIEKGGIKYGCMMLYGISTGIMGYSWVSLW